VAATHRALLVSLVGITNLAGCALYVPSALYTPLPERAGEVRVRAAAAPQGFSATASASPFQGAVVFGGIERESPPRGDTVNVRWRRQAGVGAGAYRNLGRNAIGEVLAGIDWASVRTIEDPFDFGSVDVRVQEGRLTRAYAQGDMGARIRRRGVEAGVLAFSVRLSAVRFYELTQTDDGQPQDVPDEERLTVLEPGFISMFKAGPLRLESGLRLAMPLGARPEAVGFEPLRTEVAVSVALDELWRGGGPPRGE
jgi:hypothetical protein